MKPATRRHPLDPLSAEEVGVAVRTLRTDGTASDHLRFVSVTLHEPAKIELERISTDSNLNRRADIVAIDLNARCVLEAVVSLHDETLISCEERRGVQPGIIVEEFILCKNAVKADPPRRAFKRRRCVRHAITAPEYSTTLKPEDLMITAIPAGGLRFADKRI